VDATKQIEELWPISIWRGPGLKEKLPTRNPLLRGGGGGDLRVPASKG